MNHVIYLFYQNIYTVILIDTIFSKQNHENFPFLLQRDEFLAKQEAMLVSQRLLLLEEICFFFLFVEQYGAFCWSFGNTGKALLLLKQFERSFLGQSDKKL